MHLVTQNLNKDQRLPTPRTTPIIDKKHGNNNTNELCSTPCSDRRSPIAIFVDAEDGFSSDDGKDAEFSDSFLDIPLNLEHNCEKEGCRIVTINVSGLKFETQLRTLNRLPTTLLGSPIKRDKYWDEKRNEFFFDRHRPSFPAILFYYQSGGRLIRPLEVPADIFLSELQFFEISKPVIEAYKLSEGYIMEKTPLLPKNPLQRKVWEIFEIPDSSWPARIIAVISLCIIVVSIVTFCIETLPQYKGTGCINITLPRESNESAIIVKSIPNFTSPLFVIETICILWFICELFIRGIVCPSKILFLKDVINWIDFVAILPYLIFILMYLSTDECSNSKSGILAVLRVLRVTRVFKLSKHSEGLQILGKTMQASVQELMMFGLFLGLGVLIFSGAIYSIERNYEGSHFESIPDAFWWAIVSMTTVGYGDMYPISGWGKLVGGATVISGILAVALPVPVIVTNFNNFYMAATGRGGYM